MHDDAERRQHHPAVEAPLSKQNASSTMHRTIPLPYILCSTTIVIGEGSSALYIVLLHHRYMMWD